MKSAPPLIPYRPSIRFSDRLIAALIAVLGVSLAWSQSLAVIDLRHRTAAELIPILQPLVEPGGALSGQDYKLFVRVGKANLAELRQAIETLDRQPRQLLVSVRSSSRQEIERERAAVNARLGTAHSSASVQSTQSSVSREGNGVATVRVLEGSAASIAAGQSVPVVTSVAAGGGRRPFVAGTLGYRNLTSGYLVTPRLAGERVTLQIDQQSEQPGDAGGNLVTQSLSTQIDGPLGEWLALGTIEESSTSTRTGASGRRLETQSGDRTLWVKVDVVD